MPFRNYHLNPALNTGSRGVAIAQTFGSKNRYMQYSWAIASVIVLLAGTCSAGIAIQRRGIRSPLGRNIQIGTTAAIFAVLLHNIFWEREINDMASKGWTLSYTLPAFLICLLLSSLIMIVLAVLFRRHLRLASNQSMPTGNQKAESGPRE